MRTYEVHLQTKQDGKVLVDWYVDVEPRFDDVGNYVEANLTKLDRGVIWKGKRGFEFKPETNIEAKAAGFDLQEEFRDEIDEAMRDQLAAVQEFAD